jgi:TctA family transporter
MFETNLRRTMILSRGNLAPFIVRPMSLVILAVIFYIIVSAVLQSRRSGRSGK